MSQATNDGIAAAVMAARDVDRVGAALLLVEQAQRTVEQAAQLLSPIDGMAGAWAELCDLANQIGAAWDQLDGRRARWLAARKGGGR